MAAQIEAFTIIFGLIVEVVGFTVVEETVVDVFDDEELVGEGTVERVEFIEVEGTVDVEEEFVVKLEVEGVSLEVVEVEKVVFVIDNSEVDEIVVGRSVDVGFMVVAASGFKVVVFALQRHCVSM